MKRSFLFALIAFAAMTAHAQVMPQQVPAAKDSSNMPVITFESETIDYGTIPWDADGNREFKFKNTGKEPLIISEVQRSCGCTTPEAPKDPIKPGESGIIKVHYDTKRIGNFEKTITVISNARPPAKRIFIKGVVTAPK